MFVLKNMLIAGEPYVVDDGSYITDVVFFKGVDTAG
jgi:hypothetical protein